MGQKDAGQVKRKEKSLECKQGLEADVAIRCMRLEVDERAVGL